MRVLDIAVAAGYAVLCISLISLLSPYSAEDGAISAASDARASSAIAGYIQAAGIPFLANVLPPQFCASLRESSNSTIILGGAINGVVCLAPPAYFFGSSSFSFTVSGNKLEVEAWVAER
ncbi:MAG: hypothetical protein OK474_09795 [Thaumarchaeota archaeon]|nr:hypothetical protein [Nitrososphaerota archaeon]